MELVSLLDILESTKKKSFNMKEEILKILIENGEILISSGVTLFIAWIKKKIDIRKLKKQGRLISLEQVNLNGKYK